MDNGKCFTLIIFLHTQFPGAGTLYIITFPHYPIETHVTFAGVQQRKRSTWTPRANRQPHVHMSPARRGRGRAILNPHTIRGASAFPSKKYYEESAAAGHSIYNIIKIQVEMSWCLSMRVGNSHEN
jgi:hypothetical protein